MLIQHSGSEEVSFILLISLVQMACFITVSAKDALFIHLEPMLQIFPLSTFLLCNGRSCSVYL